MSNRQRRMGMDMTADRSAVTNAGRHAVYAGQRTLRHPVECTGVGLHSGQTVTMTLLPAAAGSGILFRRTDVAVGTGDLPAVWHAVSKTVHATLLTNEHGVSLSTVEHLMAAFAGLGVDNATVLIDGPELPILDGSSADFVDLLDAAGFVEQAVPRKFLKILKPVTVATGTKSASLVPDDAFRITCDIDFSAAAIARQSVSLTVDDFSFRSEIARARTFVQVQEVEALRAHGLVKGGSLENAVVVNDAEVLNPEGLRFDDEFVRHKVLDCIGDLALAGAPILGCLEATRTGHALNNALLHAVFADPANYEFVTLPAQRGAAVTLPAAAAAAVA